MPYTHGIRSSIGAGSTCLARTKRKQPNLCSFVQSRRFSSYDTIPCHSQARRVEAIWPFTVTGRKSMSENHIPYPIWGTPARITKEYRGATRIDSPYAGGSYVIEGWTIASMKLRIQTLDCRGAPQPAEPGTRGGERHCHRADPSRGIGGCAHRTESIRVPYRRMAAAWSWRSRSMLTWRVWSTMVLVLGRFGGSTVERGVAGAERSGGVDRVGGDQGNRAHGRALWRTTRHGRASVQPLAALPRQAQGVTNLGEGLGDSGVCQELWLDKLPDADRNVDRLNSEAISSLISSFSFTRR